MAEPAPSDGWWTSPALVRVWRILGDRLERQGLVARGRVRLRELDRGEQRAVSDLLGRPVLQPDVVVDLANLDGRLRTRAGTGLLDAVTRGTGLQLEDRPARRARQMTRRAAPVEAYTDWYRRHPGHELPQLDDWFERLRRDGLLGRATDPAALVTAALDVLASQVDHLTGPGTAAPVARTELAARLLGDAHALDDDRLLTRMVLRALPPTEEEDLSIRGRWERLGVLSDRISSTCLVFGLRVTGGSAAGRAEAYLKDEAVLHLTWRDLDEGLEPEPEQNVLVCENPRVLEAAAERGLAKTAVVCTSGRANLATLELLDRLSATDARLLYHGDFDWAGIAMANQLVRRRGAEPWRMGVEDYLSAPLGPALVGARVDADWDGELAAAMSHRGRAVHEEALLPGLLDELTSKS